MSEVEVKVILGIDELLWWTTDPTPSKSSWHGSDVDQSRGFKTVTDALDDASVVLGGKMTCGQRDDLKNDLYDLPHNLI